jgi:two-component system sensor histidine kinase YesM
MATGRRIPDIVARFASAARAGLGMDKLRNRFLFVMVLLAFFPIAVVGILSFRISRSTIERNHISSYSSNLLSFSNTIDVLLYAIRRDSRSLLGHPNIQTHLSPDYPSRPSEHFDVSTVRAFDEVVTDVTISNTDIDSIFIFDNEGRGYSYSRGSLNGVSMAVASGSDPDSIPWYAKAKAASGREVFLGTSALLGDEDPNVFSVVKLLRSIDDFQTIGAMVINVRKAALSRYVPQHYNLSDRGRYLIVETDEPQWRLICCTGDGEVSLSPLRACLEGRPADVPVVAQYDGFLAIRHVNRTTGWSIIHLIRRSDLLGDARRIGSATLAISAAMIVVVVVLFAVMSRMLNRPLAKLEKVIAEVAGGRRNITEEFGSDEIGMIGRQFTEMVNNNLDLRERLLDANLKQHEAQLRALEAQVNPHFLYNTLDSIFWLAKVNKIESIATIALSLSNLFRLSLDGSRQLITVRDELEHVRSYLQIQGVRYRDRFRTEVRVEESLLDCEILKLTLQPLVENSVIHGLEAKVGQGHILLSGRREGELAVFEIVDDGVGMNAGDVRQGFGIRGVRERIRLYYGDGFGVTVESRPSEGTTVRVTLPWRPAAKRTEEQGS